MKIGIITAMHEETGAIIRAMKRTQKKRLGKLVVHQAIVFGHEIYIVEAGMGFTNATKTTRQFLSELRLDLIVSTGFCGAVSEELQVGDVVLAAALTIVSERELQEVFVTIPSVIHEFASSQIAQGCRVFVGLFAGTTAIMKKSRLASLLPVDAPFPVVEMESSAIALVAGENGILFIGLRVVSDPFAEELGFSLDEFCDARMRIRIPKVLLTIIRKPRIIPQLFRLAGNSRIAATSLSQAFERFLSVL